MSRRGAAGEAAPDAQPPVSSAPPSIPQTPLPVTARRKPVLLTRPAPSRGARCAEVAGDTAAGCAAVCCCCPCGILSLVLLAAVKLPAGLCRRAILKRKKRRKKKKKGDGSGSGAGTGTRRGLLGHRVGDAWEEDDDGEEFVVVAGPAGPGAKGMLVGDDVGLPPADTAPSQEASEMDKEMWAKFHGGGFWRSLSQRDV